MNSFNHPHELLAAMRNRVPTARAQLQAMYADTFRLALERLGILAEATDEVVSRWLTMFLASRDPKEFQRLSADPDVAWREFRSYVLFVIFRWLLWPSTSDPEQPCASPMPREEFRSGIYWVLDTDGPPAMMGYPNPNSYELAIYQRPKHHASGDLVQAVPTEGEFWLLVADGCGHGRVVNLMMRGVAFLVRQIVLAELVEPVVALQRVQERLEQHLPEGFFIEAALGRVDRGGTMLLAAAGGVGVVHRDGVGSDIQFETLSGCLLGNVGYPEVTFEQSEWSIPQGKEILLSTDGLFDQATPNGPLRAELPQLLLASSDPNGLFESVVQKVTAAVAQSGQSDDISLACLRAY